MPIQLKNRAALPQQDYQTVTVLGLEIPLTGDLPFGAQIELLDLQSRHEAGEFGQFEYLLRLFCVFTARLPKAERVRYEWLANQHLEATEVAELMQGTLALLTHQHSASKGEAEEGNAPKPKRATKS